MRISKPVAALCLAEVLGMVGFATFPALVPTFIAEWGLTHTEAGWISGIYFAGYMGAVPVLVSLTDRLDPRRIYLASTALGGFSTLGYALFAEGFWSALAFRTIVGIGLAGTYMPGLKALSDLVKGRDQSRVLAFYTSSFSVGAAAPPGRSGATMAVHSFIGFGCGFLGPLMFGLVLDLAGGDSTLGWGLAFASLGAAAAMGPAALAWLVAPNPKAPPHHRSIG